MCTLSIHGARKVLFRSKEKGIWRDRLCQRRPANVVAVSLVNKMVRIAWALLVRGPTSGSDVIKVSCSAHRCSAPAR